MVAGIGRDKGRKWDKNGIVKKNGKIAEHFTKRIMQRSN